MPRNAEHQKVCYRAECKAAWKKKPVSSHFLRSSVQSSYRGTRPVSSPFEKPIKHGGFEADKQGRRWKVAGEISPDAFHCAIIPNGPGGKWEDGAFERSEGKNSAFLKAYFTKIKGIEEAEIEANGYFADPDWQEVISLDGVKCFVCGPTT